MKMKCALLVCGLALATVMGGCGSSAPERISTTIYDTDKDKDSKEDKDTEEAKDKDESKDSEGESSKTENESQDITSQINSAYYEILKAAPAFEGDTDAIYDASMGYDDNYNLFGDHLDSYAIYDINKDGVPELIAYKVINFRWGMVYVYTYTDGKAVLVKTSDFSAYNDETFSQNASANGAYVTYFCDDNHIHSIWSGTNPMGDAEEEDTAYVLEGTELKRVDAAESRDNVVYFDSIAKSNTAENIEELK